MAILDIAQVQGFSYDNLQGDLHIGFGGDIKMRFENGGGTEQGGGSDDDDTPPPSGGGGFGG